MFMQDWFLHIDYDTTVYSMLHLYLTSTVFIMMKEFTAQ